MKLTVRHLIQANPSGGARLKTGGESEMNGVASLLAIPYGGARFQTGGVSEINGEAPDTSHF